MLKYIYLSIYGQAGTNVRGDIMADRARYYDESTRTWVPITASKATIKHTNKNMRYKCVNPLCNVDMCLKNISDVEKATFAAFPKQVKNHVSTECIRGGIQFTESKYAENKFVFSNFMQGLMQDSETSFANKKPKSTIITAVSENPPIRGLLTAYKMCVTVGTDGYYNNISINDIFAGESNYETYAAGFTGYKIVECSFYYDVHEQMSFILNYPIFNGNRRQYVKINIENRNLFFELRKKLMDSTTHREPIVVAGEWTVSEHKDCCAECLIKSKKQIAFPHY